MKFKVRCPELLHYTISEEAALDYDWIERLYKSFDFETFRQ